MEKQKKGGVGVGAEDAIVEVVEGVADHQPQRPFSSLKESLLMVQRRPAILLFFFSIIMRREGRFLCCYDFTYGGSSLDLARGK